MPMKEGYHYAPMPLDRPAAKKAPFAYQVTQQPAKSRAGVGKLGGMFNSASGGGMQGGGKRRTGPAKRRG